MGAVRLSAPLAAAQGRPGPRVEPGAHLVGVRFAGYAAIFDRVDRGGDVVRRGAFAGSLAAGVRVPLLWQHDPARVIGTVEALAEDARGLRVVARVGLRVGALVAARRMTGLSFGYRVKRAAGVGPRMLHDVELIEVSLVKQPMQPLARVIAVEVGQVKE